MAPILTALPRGGRTRHLHLPGYRPGKRPRSCAATSSLCGVSVLGCQLVPLPESIGMRPSGTDPCPGWLWCRPCVGHAVGLAGLATEVLGLVIARIGGS